MNQTAAIETLTCTIQIDEEGILRMNIKQGAQIDEDEVKKVFAGVKKLTEGKMVLELMTGGNFYTLNQEAQKYVAKYGKDLFLATALVNRSMGMRILFNFFNTFFKQPVPFKMFPDEKTALIWLRKFREK